MFNALTYPLLRPLLFGMDAEKAHDATLQALATSQNTPLQWLYSQQRVSDPVTVAGLDFPNRVGLAAGLDKNARCIDALSALGFGFVEVGTVTPKPQPGNPKPRLFRIPQQQALINRLGFNNEGLDAFLKNLSQSKSRGQANGMLLGLNIGKNATTPIENAASDYLTCLQAVYPHADYITVNISSPNTQNLRSLQSDEALSALLKLLAEKRRQLMLAHHRKVPLFIKIAPDLQPDQIALLCQTIQKFSDSNGETDEGYLGLIATNTTLSREAVAGLQHAQEAGGLSGRPVFEASNSVIRQLRQHLGNQFPIIGVGGILSASDALEKMKAGADLVQIYTGLIYRGPALVHEAALALSKT